jgi:Amt family ammonium transporter
MPPHHLSVINPAAFSNAGHLSASPADGWWLAAPAPAAPPDTGSAAWVLASAALVLMMTPGVAFFYAGMVRRTNVLNMVMQGFVTLAIGSVVWIVLGFSLAFAPGNQILGDLRWLGLPAGDATVGAAPGIPIAVFALFQMMFAVVTPALITGATAERWKFGAFSLFIALWSLLVYAPVARWVFSTDGWAHKWGALDFAGGTVVHANAGIAAVVLAYLLGRRRGWPDLVPRPHNLPMVMIGLALLWVGWMGFNGGSAYGANQLAGTAAVNTQVAASAALLSWCLLERIRYGKATTLGAASGAVAGLVAITPAAGYVTAVGALLIGIVAGMLCHLAVGLKNWFRLDDSLDVAAVHLGGGVIGSICVGLFATRKVNPEGTDGLFYGGGYELLGRQTGTVLIVVAYSAVMTLLIGGLLDRLLGNRVSPREEQRGLDLSQHGESAYDLVEVATPAATGTTTSAGAANGLSTTGERR